MKKLMKKLTIILLAGIIFLQADGIYTNNASFNHNTVNPYSLDENMGDDHTKY